jgi:hypothetical protein
MRVETTAEGNRLAVSRNISRTGLLMATATKLEPGGTVTLTFKMEPIGPREHTVEGTIVRFEANEQDPDGLWPYMVAVEFVEPDPRLEAILREAGAEADPGASP